MHKADLWSSFAPIPHEQTPTTGDFLGRRASAQHLRVVAAVTEFSSIQNATCVPPGRLSTGVLLHTDAKTVLTRTLCGQSQVRAIVISSPAEELERVDYWRSKEITHQAVIDERGFSRVFRGKVKTTVCR